MADDAQSIRSLNWRELFPFLHIFRTFRIAIDPSKLLLGFALLIFLYAGGRVLDLAWSLVTRDSAVSSEIDVYAAYRWSHSPSQGSFTDLREEQRDKNAEAYAAMLQHYNLVKDRTPALEAARVGDYHSKILTGIIEDRNEALRVAVRKHMQEIAAAEADHKKFQQDAHTGLSDAEYSKTLRKIEDDYAKLDRAAHEDAQKKMEVLASVSPHSLFDTFFTYEVRQFHDIVNSALNLTWLGGIYGDEAPAAFPDADTQLAVAPTAGVVRSLANFAVVGPSWLLRYHFVFFVFFTAWFLLLWAVFGGAIARIAAVHVARDEKISVRQALRFSISKILSFVFAPLIPLIIILVAGLLVGIGGLLLYIPFLGPIVVGALFILALLAGFVMTLVATGTVGGFNLMYPTIAVEGSDSFDAISRSFSYIFARPWKKLFYSAVAIVYGALCFLFVRFFVYVMLSFTHFFVQWFLGYRANYFWPEIWAPVNEHNLAYSIDFHALAWSECIAALLIAMWIYIVLTILASFVLSFYFSANTIIYYLMRRDVDATELDDVYVEETEDDFTEAAVTTTTATVTTTTPAAPAAPDASAAPPADAAPASPPPA